MNCTLHCNDGYSITQDAVHSYFCAYNGMWEPPYSPDRPDCSGMTDTFTLKTPVDSIKTASSL